MSSILIDHPNLLRRDNRMKIKTIIIMLLFTCYSCSFAVVKKSKKPVEYGTLPNCTQSSFIAGLDFLGFAAGVGGTVGFAFEAQNAVNEDSDQTPYIAASAVSTLATAVAASSMIYGLYHTYKCRRDTERAGYNSHGGYDWLLPPLIVVSAGAAAAVAVKNNESSEKISYGQGSETLYDQDSCDGKFLKTALCNDDTYSCSDYASGTCSHHGGVNLWLRDVN